MLSNLLMQSTISLH